MFIRNESKWGRETGKRFGFGFVVVVCSVLSFSLRVVGARTCSCVSASSGIDSSSTYAAETPARKRHLILSAAFPMFVPSLSS